MKDLTRADSPSPGCRGCEDSLQDYLDGSLSRDAALSVFLHVRECPACEAQLVRWQRLVQGLGQMPALEPPVDFDARILASVPYASYLEMAPLRRPRVPVYLQESFLPAFVRARVVRLGGMALGLGCVAAVGRGFWPPETLFVAAGGLLPEVLVRCQDLARSLALRVRRSEGGS